VITYGDEIRVSLNIMNINCRALLSLLPCKSSENIDPQNKGVFDNRAGGQDIDIAFQKLAPMASCRYGKPVETLCVELSPREHAWSCRGPIKSVSYLLALDSLRSRCTVVASLSASLL
jgi:hypothetical protein